MGRHGHVVFLVGRGRQAVDTGRIGALLVLRGQRCGRHLGDHETGVEPGGLGEERRQVADRSIHQKRDAPFGKRPDLRRRERQHVGREGHRLGMEVAAGQHLARLREHQGVVGHGVGFDFQDAGRLAHDIQTGAHDLRLAAQAIGILHLAAVHVRKADLAVLDQRPERGRHIALAAVSPQRLNAGVERRIGAERRVDR